MLKTTSVEPSVKNLVLVGKSIINKVDGSASKISKTKSKNTVILNFLAKSKLLVELSSGSGFLIFGARLAFAKSRQVFIEALIFYHFDPKCHIRVETDLLGYAISGVFSQVISDNLG